MATTTTTVVSTAVKTGGLVEWLRSLMSTRNMQVARNVALALGGAFCFGYLIANTPSLHKGPNGLGSCTTAEEVLLQGLNTTHINAPLSDRVVIVTGANSGIGFETAQALALFGARVVIPCRTMEKANEAIRAIQTYCADRGVEKVSCIPMVLDLNDLQSVRAFVNDFESLNLPLHVLINNAGIMALPEREVTAQGFEKQIGVCHLGHFLLTLLLLPTLKRSAPARVVCVSSIGHRLATDEFIKSEKLERATYDQWGAYGDAKLANLLFAREFNERFEKDGVTAYSLHPGGIHTNLQTHVSFRTAFTWAVLTPFFFKSKQQGAATSVYCGFHPAAIAAKGGYFVDCNAAVTLKEEIVNNAVLRRELWDKSAAMTGVLDL